MLVHISPIVMWHKVLSLISEKIIVLVFITISVLTYVITHYGKKRKIITKSWLIFLFIPYFVCIQNMQLFIFQLLSTIYSMLQLFWKNYELFLFATITVNWTHYVFLKLRYLYLLIRKILTGSQCSSHYHFYLFFWQTFLSKGCKIQSGLSAQIPDLPASYSWGLEQGL